MSICKKSNKWQRKFKPLRIPDRYSLDSYHLDFFLNRGNYIAERTMLVLNELVKRGLERPLSVVRDMGVAHWTDDRRHDWTPGAEDLQLAMERLIKDLQSCRDRCRFGGTYIDTATAIGILSGLVRRWSGPVVDTQFYQPTAGNFKITFPRSGVLILKVAP